MWRDPYFAHKGFLYSNKALGISSFLLLLLPSWFRPVHPLPGPQPCLRNLSPFHRSCSLYPILHTPVWKSEHVAPLDTLQWSFHRSLNKTQTLTMATGACFPHFLSPKCSHIGTSSKLMKEDTGVRPTKIKTSALFLKMLDWKTDVQL